MQRRSPSHDGASDRRTQVTFSRVGGFLAMAKRAVLRRTLKVGFLAGLGYAIWRAIEANRAESPSNWEPQPFPFPPQPRTQEPPATEPWITPVDGSCPA